MSSRPLEILNRLETIDLEAATLRKELRKALETEKKESVQKADLSMFKDTTKRLLTELWKAPNKMLTHEDIKEFVMFDPEAPDSNVRRTINGVRAALREKGSSYEIENVKGKGYRLAINETLPNVTKVSKTRGKSTKTTTKNR